jgi:hypothetical protein
LPGEKEHLLAAERKAGQKFPTFFEALALDFMAQAPLKHDVAAAQVIEQAQQVAKIQPPRVYVVPQAEVRLIGTT